MSSCIHSGFSHVVFADAAISSLEVALNILDTIQDTHSSVWHFYKHSFSE